MGTTQPAPAVQKKICMIGAYAVGKTSLVRRFVESLFDERYQTTVGVKIDRKRLVVRHRQLNLMLWDLAGDDELQQLRISHLRGASGYILVADGTRKATLDRALHLQQSIAAVLGPAPFVLAINKADLAEEWVIEDSAISQLAQSGWILLRTSAKTGEGVEDLFLILAENVLSGAIEGPFDDR